MSSNLNAQNDIFIRDTITDSTFVYQLLGKKTEGDNFSIIVNVKCNLDCSEERLGSFYNEKMFETKVLELEFKDSSRLFPYDVLSENYINFVRFIYLFKGKNFAEINKINLNNNELKILL